MKKALFISLAAIALLATACDKKDEPKEETKMVPSVTSIAPDSGYAGDLVVISGKDFSTVASENSVKFGTADATVAKASATSLTVTVPENPVGEVDVTVTVDGQKSGAVKFTYLEVVKPMTVTGLEPAEAKIGEEVVISGTNFGTDASALTVLFGDANAEIKSVEDTRITVIVPDGAGEVAVLVKKGDEILPAGTFNYKAERIVTVASVNPPIGTTGDELTIKGTGFSEVLEENVVTVNGTAVSVNVVTDTTLTVTLPELAKGQYKFNVAVKGAVAVDTPDFVFYKVGKATVSTVIGSGTAKNEEGVGTAASVQLPEYVGIAPDGSMWVTTRGGTNAHGIFRVDLSNYAVTTVVAPATIGAGFYPWSGDFDADGNFHVACKAKALIGKVDKSNNWTTYAPEGVPADIKFGNIMACKFDKNGHLYITSRGTDNKVNRILSVYNNKVEKVYEISKQPLSLIVDSKQENLIQGANGWGVEVVNIASGETKIVAGGQKSTQGDASTVTDGEPGNTLTATIGPVSGLYQDPEDNYLYILDMRHSLFRVVVPGVDGDYTKGIVKTLAGQPYVYGVADGTGSEVKMGDKDYLGQLCRDPKTGAFYFPAGNKNIIRKIVVE